MRAGGRKAAFWTGIVCMARLAAAAEAPAPLYAWLETPPDPAAALDRRFPPPAGYERASAAPGSFAEWLRRLPLKPPGSPVLLHDGRKKANQEAHAAVVDIDTGKRDLQQCADSVIRLRAEYLFAAGRTGEISFEFTSGDRADFERWAGGWRPAVKGNSVRWEKAARPDAGYPSFRRYLDVVFAYAGTISLGRQLRPVADPREMAAGDVFIRPGSPGHAAIVADVAVQPATGKQVFLILQGFMPAQDLHVLRNPGDPRLSPWYPADFGEELRTPEWTFRKGDLRRF